VSSNLNVSCAPFFSSSADKLVKLLHNQFPDRFDLLPLAFSCQLANFGDQFHDKLLLLDREVFFQIG